MTASTNISIGSIASEATTRFDSYDDTLHISFHSPYTDQSVGHVILPLEAAWTWSYGSLRCNDVYMRWEFRQCHDGVYRDIVSVFRDGSLNLATFYVTKGWAQVVHDLRVTTTWGLVSA